jgi:hypothetical protein
VLKDILNHQSGKALLFVTTGLFLSTAHAVRGRSWTPEEDAKLICLVGTYGAGNWGAIAEEMSDRTGIQCRKRWTESLDPDIKKGPWTPEEDEALRHLVGEYGESKWTVIAKELPSEDGKHRTDGQCRQRWEQIKNGQSATSESDVPSLVVPSLSRAALPVPILPPAQTKSKLTFPPISELLRGQPIYPLDELLEGQE